jgi:hypothetical protein
MNTEKQRIAIAEACGIVSKDQWGPLYKTARGVLRGCPDYCNDLNAMHEAEAILTEKQRLFYHVNLMKLQKADFVAGFWFLIHATAAHRAEAFLRTIQKWEDDK